MRNYLLLTLTILATSGCKKWGSDDVPQTLTPSNDAQAQTQPMEQNQIPMQSPSPDEAMRQGQMQAQWLSQQAQWQAQFQLHQAQQAQWQALQQAQLQALQQSQSLTEQQLAERKSLQSGQPVLPQNNLSFGPAMPDSLNPNAGLVQEGSDPNSPENILRRAAQQSVNPGFFKQTVPNSSRPQQAQPTNQ